MTQLVCPDARLIDGITVYDFLVRDGEDIVLRVAMFEPDDSAKDLTGANAAFKALDVGGNTVIDKSSAGGGITFVGNVIVTTIDGIDWQGLAGKCLSHHLRLTDGNNRASDVQQGAVGVEPSPFT